MTTEAEIGVADDEQLLVHRTMRIVADGAAFAHGWMFEYERAGLVTVTLLAAFVEPGHGESTGRFENVAANRCPRRQPTDVQE